VIPSFHWQRLTLDFNKITYTHLTLGIQFQQHFTKALSSKVFDYFTCNQAEGSSAESITALARIDTVKQRMEAAHGTLQVWFMQIVIIDCRQ
jgi:hypothetical protein